MRLLINYQKFKEHFKTLFLYHKYRGRHVSMGPFLVNFLFFCFPSPQNYEIGALPDVIFCFFFVNKKEINEWKIVLKIFIKGNKISYFPVYNS